MSVDVAALVTELLPALNAASPDDLVFWELNDLYDFADEAVKRLARDAMVFYVVDSFPTVIGQVEYPEAPLAVVTLVHLSASSRSLRATNVRELEELDATWTLTSGSPSNWTQDIGLNNLRLYPTPNAVETVERISTILPPNLTPTTATLLRVPQPFAGFLYEAMLAGARNVEGEPMMPEVAAHAASRVAEYTRIFTQYYGTN